MEEKFWAFRRDEVICATMEQEVRSMNCAHSGCKCRDASIEKNGKRYCSDHCARAGQGGGGQTAGAGKGGCGCGHPGCK